MNRGEVRTIVRNIIAEPNATGTWTNDMLNKHINSAYAMLSNEVRDKNYKYYYSTGTITTASGTRNYDLPSDYVASNILNIRNSDGYSLIPDDIRNFDTNDTGASATYYDIANNDIYFDPVPTEVKSYALEYFRVPTVLSADSTELDFPQGQEEVIAWKAAVLAKKSLDDISEYIESEYNAMYKSMLKSVVINKYIRPPQIQVSRGNFGKYWIHNRGQAF